MLSTGTAQASLKAGAVEVSSIISQWLMAMRKLSGMWQGEEEAHLNPRCPREAVPSFEGQSV